MKSLLTLGASCLLTVHLVGFHFHTHAAAADYQAVRSEAEQLVSQGSFERAHQLYASLSASITNLPPEDQRWVQFRLADTSWRSQAATRTADDTRVEEARRQLENLVRDVLREEDRDRLWAEVHESLGDLHWSERRRNWSEAWPHYEQALDWWAGARDVELARERYLGIVWKLAQPPGMPGGRVYGYWGNPIPLQVLENAIRIAQSENDKAHASYLLAITIRRHGGIPAQQARVPEAFEAALKPGKGTDWYDDALYNYAEWMTGFGDVIPLANGQWRHEPNFPKALELFRRLVREFNKGETRYYDQAEAQIRNITEPQLNVRVSNIFLPDSEIEYHLHWRNVRQVELTLHRVELTRDVKLPGGSRERQGWLQSIDLGAAPKVRSWSYTPRANPTPGLRADGSATGDEGESPRPDYRPGDEKLRLDEKLAPGAYVLHATAGGEESRELVLVTEVALVLRSSGRQALLYFCNALDGSPITNAPVRLWEQWWEGDRWQTTERSAETGTNGIAVLALPPLRNGHSRELLATAGTAGRQAFTLGNSFWHVPESERWKIYAFTDRPAYRPNETVNWKLIARQYDGANYSTPANRKIEFEVTDPQGGKLKSDTVALNAFGSAWGSIELTAEMPLGEYQVQFWDEGRKRVIGNATLFRLEEYKLPEFKVTVKTPEEKAPDGSMRPKSFRLGETVEASITAEYYFGGAVANAEVEVVVHQAPYWRLWPEPRPYPWLYEDMSGPAGVRGRWHRGFGQDQVIKRETLRTDAAGKVTISFETPANHNQDLEYRVEARVTDSSRREIVGNGSVRVTQQRYYVNAKADHHLHRPQDRVRVEFKALDANDQPVRTEGRVKVTREFWFEIWTAPDGREVKGDELKRLRADARIWPPVPDRPDQKDWQLKFRGYEHDEILTRTIRTDTNGVADLTFTPEREGYYKIAWTSDDLVRATEYARFTNYITAETTVWVANNATTELGYRHDGVEVIVDKDTFRVGQVSAVMLVANNNDRHVLFSVEGEDLYSYDLVHMSGTVKLIQLQVEERHVPNIFLNATLVSDKQIFTDTKQVVVPPTKNFLTVDVESDQHAYLPRGEGSWTVITRNDEGKPVSAEVAFGLVDESVFYIQRDYAGDPRQFFFGQKRAHRIQSQSTFQQKSYVDRTEQERLAKALQRMGPGGGFGGRSSDLFATDRLEERAYHSFGISEGMVTRSAAVPAAAPAKVAQRHMMDPTTGFSGLESVGGLDFSMLANAPGQAGEAEPEAAVVVRSDFRSTAFWQPDVKTGPDGRATIKMRFPDSTTSWKATARAVTAENRFGLGETNARTRQPLIVRLQAPRFFVVGDTATISAVVNNNSDEPMQVRVALDMTGNAALESRASGQGGKPAEQTLTVPANGDARADWTLEVKSAGEVKFQMTGRSRNHSDAMERTFTVHEHGIEKFIAKSGKARGNDLTVKLDLPKERKPGSTKMVVQVTPSMAVTMLDALPYLIDYPYGCTEQTMSRFLPAVVTAKTLRDLGLKPEDVMGRVFGGIETNFVSKTHTNGSRDLAQLERMTQAGLERLYDFQHEDGGWGWWKVGESDHWMTAYVLWGLVLARQADVEVRETVIVNAANYLEKELVEEEENPDMQAFMLHALSAWRRLNNAARPTDFEQAAFENLWTRRTQLNAYTRALFALAAHQFGRTEEARTLVANLENGVKRDDRPDTSILIHSAQPASNQTPSATLGTAHWGEDGIYWRWSEGGVEATAFALRAMLAIDPKHELVEPVSNWLIRNRRGAQWSNTRDTAIVLLALNDYLRASGELKADAEYEVLVNGNSVAKRTVSAASIFSAPSRFVIDPGWVRDNNEVRIRQTRRGGESPALYFSAEATFFSTEEPVTPAGNEIFAKREHHKLVGRPTLLKGQVFDKVPLEDGASVSSGDRIETVITIEAKNNYEYLVFEDLKAAGFEAVEIRSGEPLQARELKSAAPMTSAIRDPQSPSDYTDRERSVHQELRDRKVALFIDKLPEGIWEIRYELRAETPGRFHALPVVGHAMYVPEIRCNGAETRVTVVDR